jgi:5'-nucleotidase
MSLQNAGGVRTFLGKGELTLGDVYTLLPFGNTLVVLELSGKEIRETIDQAVDAAIHGNSGAFPYPGNARFSFDPNTSSENRVTDIEIRGDDGAWHSLEAGKTYRVAVNSYMAGGGDRYHVLKKAAGYRYDTGFVDAQIFMDYAAHLKVLVRPGQTALRVVNE